jgi:hypothetical protein
MQSWAGGPEKEVSLGLGDIAQIRGNKNGELVRELVNRVLTQLKTTRETNIVSLE